MPDEHYLFKFRSINKYFLDSIVRPALYFSKPKGFNDPFDCNINLRRIIARAAKAAINPQRVQNLRRILETSAPDDWAKIVEKVGVCSFSVSAMHILMWSHYADHHKGVCLTYQVPDSFYIEDIATTHLLGRESAHYGPADLIQHFATGDLSNRQEFLNRLIELYVTTKHRCWRYEDEVRIVRGEDGALDIPAGFVRQICFGLETLASDIDLVTTLAKAYLPQVTFTRMVRTSGEFGVRMKLL
jgi:hypothetical protein